MTDRHNPTTPKPSNNGKPGQPSTTPMNNTGYSPPSAPVEPSLESYKADFNINPRNADTTDICDLRLPDETLETVRLPGPIECRKPKKHEFFQVRPGKEWQFPTKLVVTPNDDKYLLDKLLWPDWERRMKEVCLVICISRQGSAFVWPIALQKGVNASNGWVTSAWEAVAKAQNEWVCLTSNQNAKRYDVDVAINQTNDPQWPNMSLEEILRQCFCDRIITDPDHPILQELLGA